ncbi:MAG: hypothetical protein JNM63_09755 [Spirochaetia bacterium]|nr:hypothetical protein [Spirochaetia bacterium]
MSKKIFYPETLRSFPSTATQAVFPLGGIGTGNVSIGSRGELLDWEIWNRPGKGKILPYTFFAVRYAAPGEKPAAKALEAERHPPFIQFGYEHPHAAGGYMPWHTPGLPRLRKATLRGEYPFAFVDFEDDSPLKISLTAFTPFCPGDVAFSSKPAAVFTYRVKNSSKKPVDVSLCFSAMNACGYAGETQIDFRERLMPYLGKNKNRLLKSGDQTCILMETEKYPKDHARFGTMAIAASGKDVTAKTYWDRTRWWSNYRLFWKDFESDGRLETPPDSESSPDGTSDIGSLAVRESLAPGEEKDFRFTLAWHFPNRIDHWDQTKTGAEGMKTIRNAYAAAFADASEAALDSLINFDSYFQKTELFRKSFFSSTLPAEALETVSSQISTIRTNTAMVLNEGMFAYEGSGDNAGSCQGNCTHVWNYAQTSAYLFGSLERKMRANSYERDLDEDGAMAFRTELPGHRRKDERVGTPAADGQMGTLLRFYREWKLSGDGDFLKKYFSKVRHSLDYAKKIWDADGDGVMEGKQHNTYDIEFYGANPLTGFFYLGALASGAEMAEALGEKETAKNWRELKEKGSELLIKKCWNGEYFQQDPSVVDVHPYQFGKGCLSDQLLGQWMASSYGLGYLVPEKYIRTALASIVKYNFKPDLSQHVNLQRAYAVGREPGLILCSWPMGGEPVDPFPYSDEAWTGFEFHVASHLFMEDSFESGMRILRAIAERQNGIARSPWNHPECGHHYARAMSSWGVLTALSGFGFDMTKGELSFAPKIQKEDFRTFWATGDSWGVFRQTKKGRRVNVALSRLSGTARIRTLVLPHSSKCFLIDDPAVFENGVEASWEFEIP